jgi:methyl-accepting chemotaxis protein
MTAMRSLIARVRLETLIAMLTIAAVVVATAGLMAVVHVELTDDAKQKAIDSQQLSLRIGAELLRTIHPTTEVVWADQRVQKIVMDKVPADTDFALVESITRMADDPITLFTYDPAKRDFLRTSTTVKTANGGRAVGTWLGRNSAAYDAVMAGEPYSGAADILGTQYFTVYFPILDPASNVIGILFAGTEQRAAYELAAALEMRILLASALLLPLMAIAGFFLSRWFTKPIPTLAGVMDRLARNDAKAEIPFTAYTNEIGEMARAVAIFRDNTLERIKLEAEREREADRTMARQEALESLI